MSARAKAIVPLAIVIGIISFAWTEISLNFTFNWLAEGDFFGFGVPQNLHLIFPTAFITYGLFFAAGGDNAAFGKVFVASLFGAAAALVTMLLAFTTADANIADPDAGPAYWGIALWVGIAAAILVILLVAGDWYYLAGTFPCFAAVLLWWIATGLDGYVPAPPSGAGLSASQAAAALSNPDPGIAGTGAGLGLLSTPWYWVAISSWVSLAIGCCLGILTAKIVVAITPRPKPASSDV